MYGPTETTAYLTYSDITDKEDIDIGAPIMNTNIVLLDDEGKIIEGEGEGEIVISGIGVADGYISEDPKHAFRKDTKLSDSYVYYTGDLAKRLSNGDVVYVGRSDNQIKYRGFRLGIEGIEDTIRNCVKSIHDCAVCVYTKDGSEYLTMLYLSDEEIEVTEFEAMVSDYLASYAIPLYIIRVEALPLNKNSKIDRAAVKDIVKKYLCNI